MRPRIWTEWTQWTIWMLPRMLPSCRSRSGPTRPGAPAAPATARRCGPWPRPSRSRPAAAGTDERPRQPVRRAVGLPSVEVLRIEPPMVDPVTGVSAYPGDPPVLDGELVAVAVRVQHRCGWDPAVDVVLGHAVAEQLVDAYGPLLARRIRRPRTPWDRRCDRSCSGHSRPVAGSMQTSPRRGPRRWVVNLRFPSPYAASRRVLTPGTRAGAGRSRGRPSTRWRGTRTASSAGCGSRSPARRRTGSS